MNIGEANDVQLLLGWLLDRHQTGSDADDRARAAAGRLADRANRALGAGMRGQDVTAAWPDLLQGCAGCEDCDPDVRQVETVQVAGGVL